MSVTVGYLGPRGTFTEEATRRLLGGLPVTLIPLETNSQVLEYVANGTVERGVVPIENSIEGSVPETTNFLAHRGGVVLRAEMVLPVRQHLLVQPGVKSVDIREVLSHPHAVAQCRGFLRQHLPQARVRFTDSTSEAARLVAESDAGDLAAIGTGYASEIYGLEIGQFDIHDESENFTRFVLVGRDSSPIDSLRPVEEAPGPRKTSLLVSLAENHPGALHHVLACFADQSIDLTRIESRPTRTGLGSYFFFIDCVADDQDARLQTAIQAIHEDGSVVRVLGSYPTVELPVNH